MSRAEFSVGAPFILGVNYWPRELAMGVWNGEIPDAELEAIFRRDLAQMRELGLTVARIFLLWEALQPAPSLVDGAALARVVRFCDLAHEAGIGVDLTFFTGHMSGPNWAPPWLTASVDPGPLPLVSGGTYGARGYRNLFHDPVALRAEALLVDEVLARLAGHPGIVFWNLGNEPDLFAKPRSSAEGRAWCARLAEQIAAKDDRPVTIGLHVASLEADIGLRVDQVFAPLAFATMHAYPMYSGWSKGPLDPDFVPFTVQLTAELAGKAALMEEFGGSTLPPGEQSRTNRWTDTRGKEHVQFQASEEDFAQYIEAVLPRLVTRGSLGAMLWCWADYVPALYDRPPCSDFRHERSFGLTRPDGSLKPHAEVIRAFGRAGHTVQAAATPVLDVSPDEFYRAPLEHLRRLYARV